MNEYALQKNERQNQEIISWFFFIVGFLGMVIITFGTDLLPQNPTFFAITCITIAIISAASIVRSFIRELIPI